VGIGNVELIGLKARDGYGTVELLGWRYELFIGHKFTPRIVTDRLSGMCFFQFSLFSAFFLRFLGIF
jgi:hypothetical protein